MPIMDAETWDGLYAGEDRLLRVEPNPLVVDLVLSLEPGRALDLGAGEGRHAIWLAEQGWQVTAVDFSRVALDRGRRRARELGVALEFALAGAGDFLPGAGCFDLVLIAYMHPEPEERDAVFAAVAGAVAPGGHLLVVGLDLTDPNASREPGESDWRFTPSTLLEAFPGIELARCERVFREVEQADGRERAVDTMAWGYRPRKS